MAKYWRGQRITYGTGRFKRMWVGVAIGALVVIGALVGWAAFGTLQEPREEGTAVSVASLRDEQRLANNLFELIPGEVAVQPYRSTSSGPEVGTRYWIRLRARNLDTNRSLQEPYWALSVTGWDARNQPVNTRISIPSGAWTLSPEGYADRSVQVVGDLGIKSFAVTVVYDEPGRTPATASFVYPYGR
jgi:hypothetical protein